MEDEGRSVLDARLRSAAMAQWGDGGVGEEADRLAQRRRADADVLRPGLAVEQDAAVPCLEHRRVGEPGHGLAVAADDALREVDARVLVEDVERGQDKARGRGA